ncbi:MAG: SURF1 family protein [Gammaproteobacteria bacterium]
MAKSVQFRLGLTDYTFTLRMGFLVFFLFFFCLFCLAGHWQLQRYHYKKTLVTSYAASLKKGSLSWEQVKDSTPLEFQSIVVKGRYINSLTLLIQNRLHAGKVGYEVLTPLRIAGETKLLLVNRGWIEKPKDQILPEIMQSDTEQNIKGYIKFIDSHQFILGKNILNIHSLPYVIQKIDVNEISQLTHENYFPYVLRLDPNATHGFVRDWLITAVEPSRHLGYAVQWFAMAIVLFIAYLCFSCERVKNDNAQ